MTVMLMGGKVAAATEHRNAQRVVARLAAMPPADCAVSVVTVYELFTGVAKCREPERERAKVERLLAAMNVL